MTFDDFSKEVWLILRYQDKKNVDMFLSICKKPLGLHEWTEDEIEDVLTGTILNICPVEYQGIWPIVQLKKQS